MTYINHKAEEWWQRRRKDLLAPFSGNINAGQIAQVIDNLTINAEQVMPIGGIDSPHQEPCRHEYIYYYAPPFDWRRNMNVKGRGAANRLLLGYKNRLIAVGIMMVHIA